MNNTALLAEFELIDTNKDGFLTWQEVAAGCPSVSEVEARSLVEFFDYDGDGVLNFAEFVTMQKVFMKQDTGAVEMSAVASAFRAWDKDGSGALEISELDKLKTALKIDDDVWHNIVTRCDVDRDGLINRREFKLMCQAINRRDAFKSKPGAASAAPQQSSKAVEKPAAAATAPVSSVPLEPIRQGAGAAPAVSAVAVRSDTAIPRSTAARTTNTATAVTPQQATITQAQAVEGAAASKRPLVPDEAAWPVVLSTLIVTVSALILFRLVKE